MTAADHPVVEIRIYRARPGMRAPLIALLRDRMFPRQRELGMKVVGPYPSRDDDTTFVWLRGFPDEASRQPLKDSFYASPDWTDGLEDETWTMLEAVHAIVVDETDELWERWPAPVGDPAST